MSNSAMAMQSVKQCMSVVSAVVATDYVGRMAMDMVPLEVKESYIDSAVEYVNNVYACGVDAINKMIGTMQDF